MRVKLNWIAEALDLEAATNGQPYRKEIFANEAMELVVVMTPPSDTTPYADVILPSSSYLKQDEPTLYGNGANHNPAIGSLHVDRWQEKHTRRPKTPAPRFSRRHVMLGH